MHTSTAKGWLCAAALFSVALVGCNSKTGTGKAATPGHDHGAGEHGHAGPHGGHLIELGQEEYHAELIHDEAAHVITVYILDGKAKTSVPISDPEVIVNIVAGGAPKQFKLAALPQAGESPMASCFRLESEELCDALDAANAKGRLAVTINSKRFIGDIEHENHGHEKGGERQHK